MRTRHLTISLASALCLAGGCGSQQVVVPPEPASALSAPASARGLTVRWIGMSAEDGQIALLRQLEPFLNQPAPALSPVDVRRWSEHGLAVAMVPASAVKQIESALPVTAIQANNSADLLVWSVVATGPAWDQPRPIASPDGITDLDAGRIRMLGRSWAATSLTAAGPSVVTRLELILQHLPEGRSFESSGLAPNASKGALARGAAFERTMMGVDLQPDQCLIVFAESPGTNRQALLRPETLERPETNAASPAPRMATLASLGELLLTGYTPDGQERTRVALVIMGRPAAAAAGLDR